MDVMQAIEKRYSCRSYHPDAIEEDKLGRILEAARLAPSARNQQEWRFVVVRDEHTRRKLSVAAANQDFVAQAPVVIVGCTMTDRLMRCGQPSGVIDTAIAMEHIALQAVEEGLATCWVGAFYPDKVKPILNIPDEVTVVELMSLGYPADEPVGTPRCDMPKIVSFDSWQF
ncbi:NADH dehydrogenase [Anaerohalosphaera lusitana]|uniref:NADH dehydrogenase n=1 Tax=Anaerohalosphaera lusitana TaxID=1936003 RepID=A0A1U9NKM8_9BACT|nr:nitroreductase family protein [Anaerohalosphaera lusitana]AQT68347.1 NADH dehydrogenase [Anaerohalosphaera lusitana]